MALIPLFPEDFRFNSVKVHPTQTFMSSSVGITGDVFLFAERSNTLKDITNSLNEYHFDSLSLLRYNINAKRVELIHQRGDLSKTNISSIISSYIEKSSGLSGDLDNQKKLITYRFDMPHEFNANTIRKSIFINNLLPFYQNEYEKPLSFTFSNFHSLNFFTSTSKYPSNVPSDSALVYPTKTSANMKPSRYFPSASFSFQFYINPRYTTDDSSDPYSAGAILHMPNAYCISLLSGSGKDHMGRPNTFRLALQLRESAQKKPQDLVMPPSGLASGSLSERIFFSDDNFLKLNTWSHCTIRWGGENQNNSTGSFYIDGQNAGNFVINDSEGYSLTGSYSNPDDIPCGLVVGNRYEASNDVINNIGGASISENNRAARMNFMFSSDTSSKYGTEVILTGSSNESFNHEFTAPLNAELQEVRIFSKYRTDEDISNDAKFGYYDFDDSNLLFYVPPYFIPSSSNRRMLKTPSQFSLLSSSNYPFNLELSFGLGARSINLENFVIDLVNGSQPRCFQLEETAAEGTFEDFDSADFDFMPATEALYLRPQNRKRNLTILPSDLGSYHQNPIKLDERVSSLTKGESNKYFTDNNGHHFPGHINLLDMIDIKESHEVLSFLDQLQDDANVESIGKALLPNSEVSIFTGYSTVDGKRVPSNPVVKTYNEVYGGGSGSQIDLTVLNRTKDTHSNEITFFDISNIFYGDLVKEESFYIYDKFVTGSAGKVRLTFRDNGMGELYRCDATGSHPTWAAAGKILYEEGLVALLDPTIPPFGKEQFTVDFRGDRNIHVLEMRVPIEADEALSSSNPTFKKLKPTSLPSDSEMGCNLITNMFIHDENMNVIGKVNLSRPIVRKDNDKYVFKFKMDF